LFHRDSPYILKIQITINQHKLQYLFSFLAKKDKNDYNHPHGTIIISKTVGMEEFKMLEKLKVGKRRPSGRL